jgi:SPP1 gp7 family putative phage head morphogenesis protein
VAVTATTLRLLGSLRIQLAHTVDGATDDLVRAWARAWQECAREWQALATEVERLAADGKLPTGRQLARLDRAQRALDVARKSLDDACRYANARITNELEGVTSRVAADTEQIVASQLPQQPQARLQVAFNRVDPESMSWIVQRSTQQITALTMPLSAQATEAMKDAIVRAVALGDNPRAAARAMLRQAQDGFAGGLTRAMTIARTEILDAHRAAGLATDKANKDVLDGWEWICACDRRSCCGCWSMHGTRHPVDEAGPQGHQNCRCSRGPITKTWRELGFDIDEPESSLQDARSVFNALPEADQLAVMGPTRLGMLRDGTARWEDLSVRRPTEGWRDAYYARSVTDLQTLAARRG